MTDDHARTQAARASRWKDHTPKLTEEVKREAARRIITTPEEREAATRKQVATRMAKRLAVETEESIDPDTEDPTETIIAATLMLGRPKLDKWAKELIRFAMENVCWRAKEEREGIYRMREKAEENDG